MFRDVEDRNDFFPTLLRVLVLFFIPANLGATAIVVVVGEHEVAIAADGRGTKRIPEAVAPECKIAELHGIVFAYGGRIGDQAIGWDLRKATESAISGKNTLDGAVNALHSSLMKSLVAVVNDGRIKSPDSYQQWLSGIPVFGVVLAAVEGGTARAARCEFKINAGGSLSPSPCEFSRVTAKGTHAVMELGVDDVATILRGDPAGAERAMRHGLVNFAIACVRMDIAASYLHDNSGVGAPISALLIDEKGVHWNSKGSCAEDRTIKSKDAKNRN